MKRNYGVDIAKIVAMVFVMILHNNGQGGFLGLEKTVNSHWFTTRSIESLAIVAVNIFGIVSGFLMVGKKFKLARVIDLVLTAWFWSVLVLMVLIAFGFSVTPVDVMRSLMPLSHNAYWYVNAYIGLALLAPFLNVGLQAVSKKNFKKILISAYLISTTVGFFNNFFLARGYSSYWLIVLYLTGAYFRLYGLKSIKASQKTVLLWYLIFTFATVGLETSKTLLSGLSDFLKINITDWSFISYLPITVVLASISLFIFLVRIDVRNPRLQKIIALFSKLSFGAYLIDTSLFFNYVLRGSFVSLATKHATFAGLLVVLGGIVLFIGFSMMELVRQKLFKILKVATLIDKVAMKIEEI